MEFSKLSAKIIKTTKKGDPKEIPSLQKEIEEASEDLKKLLAWTLNTSLKHALQKNSVEYVCFFIETLELDINLGDLKFLLHFFINRVGENMSQKNLKAPLEA